MQGWALAAQLMATKCVRFLTFPEGSAAESGEFSLPSRCLHMKEQGRSYGTACSQNVCTVLKTFDVAKVLVVSPASSYQQKPLVSSDHESPDRPATPNSSLPLDPCCATLAPFDVNSLARCFKALGVACEPCSASLLWHQH